MTRYVARHKDLFDNSRNYPRRAVAWRSHADQVCAYNELTATETLGQEAFVVVQAARGDSHFHWLNKEWHRIRKLAWIEDVRIHDLRHTFASVGAEGCVGLPLIGGILGHRQASTTQRYAHLADGPLRTAADLIGSELAAALAGSTAGPR